MKASTKKAMDMLTEHMVQMRHDAVEEIKDEFRDRINELIQDILERYIVIDKQTRQPVKQVDCDFLKSITNSEWWEHEILELLKYNEDAALEQMYCIADSKNAPDEGVRDSRSTGDITAFPVPRTLVPVGRDQCIKVLQDLHRSLRVQNAILHQAIHYLSNIPEAVDADTATQEARSIAKMKHLVHSQWVGQARKAQNMYNVLMKGRGGGFGDRTMNVLQEQLTKMDMS